MTARFSDRWRSIEIPQDRDKGLDVARAHCSSELVSRMRDARAPRSNTMNIVFSVTYDDLSDFLTDSQRAPNLLYIVKTSSFVYLENNANWQNAKDPMIEAR